jgi:hypothetical protein
MPTAVGPNPSLDSNIIFSYDVGDTLNSYKGEPTTNYQWNGGSEVTPWTVGGINTDVTNTINQGPIIGAKTWKFQKTGTSNQWNGWESSYGGIWTGNAGDIWTTSYWYKTTNDAGMGGFWVGAFYKSDWSAPYNTTVLSSVSSIIPDGQWHYNYTTTQFNENYSNAIIVDGPSWGYSGQAGELYINGLQWEKKPHSTPFAYGTRSATQGLLPLIGNASLDISNVSFTSNAQMTFDGTNDFFNIPTNFGTVTQYTVEYVAYLGAAGKMPIAARTNGNFYKYGDYSWRYVHGGVGDEFYHEQSPAISGYIHCIVTYDGSLVRVWRNGYYAGAKASSGTADFSDGFKIGYWAAGGSYAWSGPIPIAKIYNVALSPDQVQQNYRQYKTRFNLS